MYLIPPVLHHYLLWDYSIHIDQHIPEPESKKRKRVVITDLEDGTVLEPLNTSRLDGATEAVDICSEEEMSSEKTDEDWDFNWMGTLKCHVFITELDDEIEVQHDKCDKRTNVEQDVNIATEDETNRVQDQTTCDVTTRVEPQVDQTNVTTAVQDEHASIGIS
ncbi:hypothetical protein Fot_44444 [Forsythia ovata]|uniref:Uncharacterized protein n=1 Tax=Forsythia ovata TaxID=205694 RepID=A0ABD1R3J5_9LAMI